MTDTKLPPTPHEPSWWDGISHKPIDPLEPSRRKPWLAPTSEMMLAARATQEYVSTSSPVMLVAYFTIGNSDDKLTQSEWAEFVREFRQILAACQGNTHGIWYSAPDAPWQNMCVCREIHRDDLTRLRAQLKALREHYRQDSVAMVTTGRTEMI